MNIAVPSRFACLNPVEDDSGSSKRTDKKKEKPQWPLPNNRKVDKPINDIKKNTNKQSNNKKEKKSKVVSDKQWEEWKQKDDEFVNGNFQQDLQSAILLSKLEYESKKDSDKKQERENERKNDKKKKTKTMSLDEFLGCGNEQKKENGKLEKIEKDENFFEKIKLEAKQEYTKDRVKEDRKNREVNIEEKISAAQYQEKLLVERQKNIELSEELEQLKIEIADVKKRNKTLCGILGHGEMRNKADVLMELERLNNVKNELTDEVAKLYAQLEKERSKVAALTAESQKVKDKKHKKHA